MWDKLLEGRTVHPRHMRRTSVPPDHGRLSEPGPPSKTFGATDHDGPTRDRIVRFGIATCIGERLRATCADLVREPVPERFMEVLRELAEPGDGAEVVRTTLIEARPLAAHCSRCSRDDRPKGVTVLPVGWSGSDPQRPETDLCAEAARPGGLRVVAQTRSSAPDRVSGMVRVINPAPISAKPRTR
jgi:Anti-sigma factor NepR